MSTAIKLRGDTTANWNVNNPLLLEREIVVDTTLNRFKIGDGVTLYNSLPYMDAALVTELGLKAPIANPTFTGTVNGITKAMVGLGNVDNTSDEEKPISTLQATGLAPKANPTISGVVTIVSNSSPAIDINNNSIIGIFNQGSSKPILKKTSTSPLMSDTTILIGNSESTTEILGAKLILENIPTFADNAEAAALPIGSVYRTITGILMIKY